jgi:site-specific DNA-cytosine methylase
MEVRFMSKFKQPKTNLKAIGINIYGGGFTTGVLNHFKVLSQMEECNAGAKTFELNFGDLIDHPIDHDDWAGRIKKHKNYIDFVYANPPCAPWSSANSFEGQNKEERMLNPKLDLTKHTMDAAFKLKPKVFILESVENAYTLGNEFYEIFKKKWLRAGYAVTYLLTDAILHGSPSMRRRFHFIAHNVPLQLVEPKMIKSKTVKDAIGDLRFNKSYDKDFQHIPGKPHRTWAPIYPLVPAGGHLRKTIELLGDKYSGPRASFLVTKLDWNTVSSTMITREVIHPDGKRLITMRELLRLCTYPDNFKAHNFASITQAVIPTVGNFMAELAKNSIRKCNRTIEPKFNVVDWRPIAKPFHGSRVRGKLDYETPLKGFM